MGGLRSGSCRSGRSRNLHDRSQHGRASGPAAADRDEQRTGTSVGRGAAGGGYPGSRRLATRQRASDVAGSKTGWRWPGVGGGAAMSNRRRMTDEEFAELRALANEHCEQIVTAYLGQPLKRTRREVRWGEKTGSFVLVISGRKRGSWYEHNGGGGMLEFLRQQHGGDWGRGIDAAIQFTGYAPPSWNDNGLSDEAIRALVE